MKALLTAVVVLLILPYATYAQEGLYAPRLPGDTVLVRVANLSNEEYGDIDIGPITYATPGPKSVGPYRPVPPGIFMVGSPSDSVLFSPEPGAFATIVVTPEGGLALCTDERHADPARAQLVLYNFSGSNVDFTSLEPAAMLVSGVDDGASGKIVVNAISLLAAVVQDGELLFDARITAERGSSYSVFAVPDGGFVSEASVASE